MTLKLRTGTIVASLAALCCATASAEEGSPPAEGRRVRVTAPGFAGRPVIGDLIASDSAKLEVQKAGSSEVVAIPRRDVTRFEVRTHESRKGRGAGIGALVGLGVGVAVGFAAGEDCGAPDAPSFVCISRPASAVGAGLAGAGVGAVLGHLFASGEKWQAVDQGGMRVSFTPPSGRSGGFGLALSVTF